MTPSDPPLRPDPGLVPGFADGISLHLRGLRLLWGDRSLWRLAAVPFLVAWLCLGGAALLLTAQLDVLYGLATGWIPSFEAQAWYTWLWVAPLTLLTWLVGGLFVVLAFGFGLVAAFLLASLIASPFNDALARAVEERVEGCVVESQDSGLWAVAREGGRSLLEELRRLLFFAAMQLALWGLGLLLPGGPLLVPPLSLALTVFFLPLDYASYTLDRRCVRFPAKRRWAFRYRSVMLGFGAGAFATLLVPGLNFLAMPALVVSGTLLALRYPPASSNPS